jgi:hypothetical protein
MPKGPAPSAYHSSIDLVSLDAGKDIRKLAAVVILRSVWGVTLLRFPLYILDAILTGKGAGMCVFSGEALGREGTTIK